MNEKELTQYSFIVKKLMIGSQKLNEIISSTKCFGDKQGVGYDEGCLLQQWIH